MLFFARIGTYDINNLGNSYVVGLNGWYEGKNGIERCPEDGLRALCGGYKYKPGEEVRIVTGIVDGHSFLYADDEFIAELIDPHYISGGYVGFSPYSTMLAIKDIEIREAVYETLEQSYEPEFSIKNRTDFYQSGFFVLYEFFSGSAILPWVRPLSKSDEVMVL